MGTIYSERVSNAKHIFLILKLRMRKTYLAFDTRPG